MGIVIGVDLGTTSWRVAFIEDGKPVVIPNSQGTRSMPSVVSFQPNGQILVGNAARRKAITNPDNTVMSVKRHIGTGYRANINGKDYTTEQLLAIIFEKIMIDAKDYLGESITQAVITVPGCFDITQRRAIRDSGYKVGLEFIRVISEQAAAALSYGIDKPDLSQKLLVFDLGGGTLGVSILEIGDGVYEVKAVSGIMNLGGDDFDERIVAYMVEMFKRENNIDLSNNKMALQRLKEAAENAKIELSSYLQTNINIPFITADASDPKHLDMDLTRDKFNELTHDLVEATLEPMRRVLNDAGLSIDGIDKVILIGGSTRIPAVEEAVKSFTGKTLLKSANVDECVAVGAAYYAALLCGKIKDILILDVSPSTLGVETMGGISTPLIPKNITVPTKKSQVFSIGADNHTSVVIHVVEGEKEKAADNKTIGRFILSGIEAAPKGIPRIEVIFDVFEADIVNVTAKDQGTGKEVKVTIDPVRGDEQ